MSRSLLVLAVVALSACPVPVPAPDGGDNGDGGINPLPMDACSGMCAINQRCDTNERVCKDGCAGACDGGTICQRVTETAFQCTAIVTSCKGVMCTDPGQIACLGGACSCLGPSRGVHDSCYGPPLIDGQGGVCGPNNVCVQPKRFQQCKGTSAPEYACPTGLVCNPVFGDVDDDNQCDNEDTCVCTDPCMTHTECERGELCSSVGCLPAGLFNGQECAIQVDGGTLPDGGNRGLMAQTVTAASLCLRKDTGGNFTETTPTGTCSYAFFYLADQGPFVFTNCRPPGAVDENQQCNAENFSVTMQANQCNTGLECAGMRGGAMGTDGLCMRTCNALPPSVTYPTPYPQCADPMNEACVNLYRREDTARDGALLGVCARKCNVFDPAKSVCPNYGAFPAVCVPTNPDGRVVVSGDGSGVCLPQRTTVAAVDMPCDQTDPFKGAACGAGQLCPPASFDVAAVCTRVCDTSCTPSADAGVPARCATQVNSTCPAGKVCRGVTTTTGSRVGFCQ